jgi:hypothetical protein
MAPAQLRQYFYVYDLPNGEVDGMPHVDVIVERITFHEGWKPEKLDIPGWRGWLEDLVMSGKHPF